MPDLVLVRGIRAEGRHGVLESERSEDQPFEVDLEVEFDLAGAAASDDLADTVDYALLAAEAAETVRTTSFSLLERLAQEIATAVLAHRGVDAVTVTLRKTAAPVTVPVGDVGVRITRRGRELLPSARARGEPPASRPSGSVSPRPRPGRPDL